MVFQEPVPMNIQQMSNGEVTRRIAEIKSQLGSEICIMGHHYQTDDVIAMADFAGDSLELARVASRQKDARFIIFCGVRFMAESAAVLTSADQQVILPNLLAGCPMAEMADTDDLASAIEELEEVAGEKVLPVMYINSTAAAKAITGHAGGICCTSSNSRAVFQWALAPKGGNVRKLLIAPDQHLGWNTAVALGYSLDDCALYDPDLPDGGLTVDDIRRATFILWKGYCYVHQQFSLEQIREARELHPGTKVMVHPECPREIVEASDASGSTKQIIEAVAKSEPGSSWALGTESHLVLRLAAKYPDRNVYCLSPKEPVCLQMKHTDLYHLLWSLEGIVADQPKNIITVEPELAADARLALSRMLDIPITGIS